MLKYETGRVSEPIKVSKVESREKMECNQGENKIHCNCTYEPCNRKGICCQCIAYHLVDKELPACAFPPSVEKIYDRSFQAFISTYDK